jgi:antitoxin HicB
VKSLRYTILLHPAPPEEGGYGHRVPALPGVVTEGDTLEEAIAMAREAIELHIEGLIADGVPIPEEDAPPQVVTLTVEVAA